MRAIVRDLIIANAGILGIIPADRWMAASSITTDPPPRPFAVIRFGITRRGMAHIKRIRCEIWVHDEVGTYTRIDDIVQRLQGILDGVRHVNGPEGQELISSDWVSDSRDLYDPGFRTNTKTTEYDLVGTGV